MLKYKIPQIVTLTRIYAGANHSANRGLKIKKTLKSGSLSNALFSSLSTL